MSQISGGHPFIVIVSPTFSDVKLAPPMDTEAQTPYITFTFFLLITK